MTESERVEGGNTTKYRAGQLVRNGGGRMAKNNERKNRREEMKRMTNKNFMTAQDVADALGVSKSYAYKLVRQLNDEMEALGYITVRGRVDANYFRKKVCYSE